MNNKLYCWTDMHFFLYSTQMAAKAAGIGYETVIVPKESELNKDKDFMAKKAHGKFPMLEKENGEILFESVAIARHFLREGAPAMLGSNAFQEASVEQWCSYASCTLSKILMGIAAPAFGWSEDMAAYDA